LGLQILKGSRDLTSGNALVSDCLSPVG